MATKLQQITTPIGIAVYPWLNKPDTKFKEEGEYRISMVLGQDESEPLRAIADKAFADNIAAVKKELIDKGEGAKAKQLKSGALPYAAQVDKETGDETGNYVFKFSMKAQFTSKKTGMVEKMAPALFDSQGKPMTDTIYGGSKVRISAAINPWYTAALGAGVSFRLRGVQIIELVTSSGGDASSMGFGAIEDGYVAKADPLGATSETGSGSDEEF